MGLHLAMIGSINDEILNIEELALEVIRFLVREYPAFWQNSIRLKSRRSRCAFWNRLPKTGNACKRAAHWTMQRLPHSDG